jgi:ABC-type uncharacterized transport system permease subunit
MSIIVSLLVICLIIAIAYWAINQLTLPPPVRMVVIVIIALVAILFLLQFVGGVPGLRLGR